MTEFTPRMRAQFAEHNRQVPSNIMLAEADTTIRNANIFGEGQFSQNGKPFLNKPYQRRLFRMVFATNLALDQARRNNQPIETEYQPLIDALHKSMQAYPNPIPEGVSLHALASRTVFRRQQRDIEMATVIGMARDLASAYLHKDTTGKVQPFAPDLPEDLQRQAAMRDRIRDVQAKLNAHGGKWYYEQQQQQRLDSKVPAKGHEWESREDVWHNDYIEGGKEYRFGVPQSVVENGDGLKFIEDILATPYTHVRSLTGEARESKRVDRNLARAVMPRQFILDLEAWRKQQPESLEPSQRIAVERWNRIRDNIEGVFSLANVSSDENYALRDCYQIFFGRNNPLNRITSSQQMAAEMTHARDVFGQRAGTEYQPFDMKELNRKGYRIEQLTAQSDWVDQYRKLIEDTFGAGTDMPGEVHDKTSIVLVVIDKQGNVVSGVTAYKDEDEISRVVERGGRKKTIKTPVRVYEIENAVTASGHEGQGLYTALSADVMNKLAQVKPPIHLVYRSTNANSENGLSASAHIDRTLAEGLGLPVKPFEQQNIDAGRFVDGIISYVPGNELRSRQWVSANAA